MSISLTHLALHVRDLDACVEFFQSYAGMRLVHQRISDGNRIVWLAEPNKESEFVLVILPGGPGRNQSSSDFSHLGFALGSRTAVAYIADRTQTEGILECEQREEPYPVGYYCCIKDPDGNFVEFSSGQLLGPGSVQMES